MTLIHDIYRANFDTSVLLTGREVELEGPSEEGDDRSAFDADAGNRPSDPETFETLALRSTLQTDVLSIAADAQTVTYTIAVEELNDSGRQWTPQQGWTLTDYGPVGEAADVGVAYEVKSCDLVQDGVLFKVVCVRKK